MKKTILAFGLLIFAACGTPTDPGATTTTDTTKADAGATVTVVAADTTKVDSTAK